MEQGLFAHSQTPASVVVAAPGERERSSRRTRATRLPQRRVSESLVLENNGVHSEGAGPGEVQYFHFFDPLSHVLQFVSALVLRRAMEGGT